MGTPWKLFKNIISDDHELIMIIIFIIITVW